MWKIFHHYNAHYTGLNIFWLWCQWCKDLACALKAECSLFVAGYVRHPVQHRLDVMCERIQALHVRWIHCCRRWWCWGCVCCKVNPALWKSARSACRRSHRAGPSPPGRPRERDHHLPVSRWCLSTGQDFLLHWKGKCIIKKYIKARRPCICVLSSHLSSYVVSSSVCCSLPWWLGCLCVGRRGRDWETKQHRKCRKTNHI